MASLNDIALIAITGAASQLTRPGYGVPLIMDFHTRYTDRVRFYSGDADGLAAMLADGFVETDAAVGAFNAARSQNPAPARIAIGRRANAPDLTIEISVTANNLRRYSVDLVGTAGQRVTVFYDSDANATVAEIVAGLVLAINTAAVGIVATDVTSTIVRCKAAAPGTWFGVAIQDLGLMGQAQVHADPGITADLNAVALANGDFYGVTLTTQGKAETLAAEVWTEANKKLGGFPTQDTDTINAVGGNVMLTSKASGYFRSGLFFRRRGDQFYGAALLGSVLPLDPGGVIFAFRKLAGQEADALTATHIANLKAANGGWFANYGGRLLSMEGKSAAGDWLDAVRDRDWLESELQFNVVDYLTASDKTPYTDRGASGLIGVVQATLDTAVERGVLANDPAPLASGPRVANVSQADRAARKYRPIRFSGRLAGAIQFADVQGNVTP